MPEYSPALSIVTAALELLAAGWTLRAHGRREVRIPVALMFLFLAGYQLIEVFVCADPTNVFLSRAAFVDVVWLPPLGLLLLRLGRPRRRLWTWLVYGTLGLAGIISVWVSVDPTFVTGTVCQAVIAFYTHPTSGIELYGMFYHAGLWAMMAGGIRVILKADDPVDRAHAADFVMGTVGFVVLALTTEVVFPGTRNATPSVMCHYAIILALFLARLMVRESRARARSTPDRPSPAAPPGS
jgi:hypothetical protein